MRNLDGLIKAWNSYWIKRTSRAYWWVPKIEFSYFGFLRVANERARCVFSSVLECQELWREKLLTSRHKHYVDGEEENVKQLINSVTMWDKKRRSQKGCLWWQRNLSVEYPACRTMCFWRRRMKLERKSPPEQDRLQSLPFTRATCLGLIGTSSHASRLTLMTLEHRVRHRETAWNDDRCWY